jgi:hypothetical protein
MQISQNNIVYMQRKACSVIASKCAHYNVTTKYRSRYVPTWQSSRHENPWWGG